MGDRIEHGYILLARRMAYGYLMDKPPMWLKLWVWMLFKARFKDGDQLKRGQLLTTINDMRDAMAYRVGYRTERPSRDQIRNAYEAFANALMITTAKTTRGLIITICKYEKYQNSKNYETHTEDQHEDTTKTQQGPHYREGMSNERGMNDNTPPKGDDKKKPTWKTDFTIYLTECRKTYKSLLEDSEWVKQQEKLNPGVDISLTMEKAATNYWATEGAWKKKKRQKIKDMNWKTTWQNAISTTINRVYKDAIKKNTNTPQPQPKQFEHRYEDEQS